jgi:uncharacterized protein YeeX (DUF496 family)
MKNLKNKIQHISIDDISKKISWDKRIKIFGNLKEKETDGRICFSIYEMRWIIQETLYAVY